MFEKILVPLDGSQTAESILPYISQLAKGLDTSVVVLVVAPTDEQQSESLQERIETYLNHIQERLTHAGVEAQSATALGLPAEMIVETAEIYGCSVIALSTHSGAQAGRNILGSVTLKILHSSPIPILTITPDKAAQYKGQETFKPEIIVPLDGSPFAETALLYAEDLARKLSSDIVLARAVSPSSLMADPFVAGPVNLEPALKSEAQLYLNDAAEKLTDEGLTVSTQVLDGDPIHQITEALNARSQSLLVMTSHGRSALARWLLGSVADAVVRTAEDAVLVIPRQYGRRQTLKVTDMLERTPLFSGLGEDDLESLAQAAHIRTYHPQDIIVRQGEVTGGLFLISTGKVEVREETSQSDATVLATLGPGDFFGEMAVIDDHPRSATVRAVEDTECVAIRRADFLSTLQRRPEIAVQMLPELVRRLRDAQTPETE